MPTRKEKPQRRPLWVCESKTVKCNLSFFLKFDIHFQKGESNMMLANIVFENRYDWKYYWPVSNTIIVIVDQNIMKMETTLRTM